MKTSYNKWQVDAAIVRLRDAIARNPVEDTKLEQGVFRLAALILAIMAVFFGITGFVFQNQFSGFAFFLVSIGAAMSARRVRNITI